jgi:hypothetical protein
MGTELAQKYLEKPLTRFRFALSLVAGIILYLVVTVALGLNFGLKNILFIFIPVSVVFILFCGSLFSRRFYDAGLNGMLFGAGTVIVAGTLFASGFTSIALLALLASSIVAWVMPSRNNDLA